MFVKHVLLIFLISLIKHISAENTNNNDSEYWQGNWFPHDPGTEDSNHIISQTKIDDEIKSTPHNIPMGVIDTLCDDGVKNLTVDWDGFVGDYICFSRHFRVNFETHPILSCDYIPKRYTARHFCMNYTIEYDNDIPSFGDHRPLWAVYGEYLYLPKQRWLHNLEHGGIVMLYHPCADKRQVSLLKKIIKRCIYRHIITPSVSLPQEMPLALVTWGCRLLIPAVDVNTVETFLQNYALKGPEMNSKNGQFKEGLIEPANIVYDQHDTKICP